MNRLSTAKPVDHFRCIHNLEFRTLYADSSRTLNGRRFRFLYMGEPLAERVRAILAEQKLRPADLVKVAEVSKGLVSQWLNDQRVSMGYAAAQRVHRKYGYAMDWLMEGKGPKKNGLDAKEPSVPASIELTPQETDLIARYRAADPRWQLSLRLLAALATEDQIEVASDVNVLIARVFRKKPADVKYASDERVAAALGDAPHVARRKAKERSQK